MPVEKQLDVLEVHSLEFGLVDALLDGIHKRDGSPEVSQQHVGLLLIVGVLQQILLEVYGNKRGVLGHHACSLVVPEEVEQAGVAGWLELVVPVVPKIAQTISLHLPLQPVLVQHAVESQVVRRLADVLLPELPYDYQWRVVTGGVDVDQRQVPLRDVHPLVGLLQLVGLPEVEELVVLFLEEVVRRVGVHLVAWRGLCLLGEGQVHVGLGFVGVEPGALSVHGVEVDFFLSLGEKSEDGEMSVSHIGQVLVHPIHHDQPQCLGGDVLVEVFGARRPREVLPQDPLDNRGGLT